MIDQRIGYGHGPGSPGTSSGTSRAMDDDHHLMGYRWSVANGLEQRMRAWNLVYQVYRGKGFAEERESELWYGPHDALEATTTFLVERGSQAVATCTAVPDNPGMGLPADGLYAERLNRMRDSGRRLCELISLVNVIGGRSGQAVLWHLFRCVYLTSRCLDGATDLVVTVNPRHRVFYQRMLLFECIGEERDYGKVQGAPAVLMHLDYETMLERYAAASAAEVGSRDIHQFFAGPRGYDQLAWIAAARRDADRESLERWFARGLRGCA